MGAPASAAAPAARVRRPGRLSVITAMLRRAREPVTAERIAATLGVSRRTVYRDIDALVAANVPVRGEAGVGYMLDRTLERTRLALTGEEAAAVALGARWVAAHADAGLARAARAVLGRLAGAGGAGTPPPGDDAAAATDLGRLRLWCREGRRLAIAYVDESGRTSERVIRPFLVGHVDAVRVVAAWCELHDDFRTFRTDRLARVDYLVGRYPGDPLALRRRWLAHRRQGRAARRGVGVRARLAGDLP